MTVRSCPAEWPVVARDLLISSVGRWGFSEVQAFVTVVLVRLLLQVKLLLSKAVPSAQERVPSASYLESTPVLPHELACACIVIVDLLLYLLYGSFSNCLSCTSRAYTAKQACACRYRCIIRLTRLHSLSPFRACKAATIQYLSRISGGLHEHRQPKIRASANQRATTPTTHDLESEGHAYFDLVQSMYHSSSQGAVSAIRLSMLICCRSRFPAMWEWGRKRNLSRSVP